MKILILSISILLIQCVRCQSAETFTETLLRAQDELSTTQEFTETQFIRHRLMIVETLEWLTKLAIDLHLDSVATVRSISEDTRQQMVLLESNRCTEDAQARWERQFISHGYRLNYCLSEAKRMILAEYYDLWYFDKDGARVSNHVPNQSLHIMTQYDPVDPANDFYFLINRRLRDLLLRAGPWVVKMDELVELMHHHIEVAEYGIRMCNRIYTSQFVQIAANAIENIQRCV